MNGIGWGGFPAPVAQPAPDTDVDGRNNKGEKLPPAPTPVIEAHRPSMAVVEKLLDNPNLSPEQRQGYRAILNKMGVKP